MEGSHAHLIGIGGNGMRALADVLRGWGWSVSGSDLTLHGHAAENLPSGADLVIYSDAVPPENPELRRAVESSIPALSYFRALGRITRCRTGFQPVEELGQAGNPSCVTLAIAGTHGKSTTAAMIAHILAQAGCDPTVFCGAAPLGKTSGGRAGGRGLFVVEACEYRKNFLHLRPTHAAILGIEADHFDCFENLAEVEAAFRHFARLLPVDGLLLFREDCPATKKIVRNLRCRKLSFGFSPTADWFVRSLCQERGHYRFSIFKCGEFVCEVPLPVPGRHNALNALAAAAMCSENGASAEQIRHGLETFPGLHCRFEIVQSSFPHSGAGTQFADAPAAKETLSDRESCDCDRGVGGSSRCAPTPERGNEVLEGQVGTVCHVCDYAHHPTEVAAALQTVREVFPNRRVWCIFQPHQASRTARLLDELASSLQNADKVIVADIFRAREGPPQPGEVTAADLARRTAEIALAGKDAGKVLPAFQTDNIKQILATQTQPGDVIVTLGAGDIHFTLGLET